MEISDSLQTLYSAEIDEQNDGSYTIEVPKREVVDGGINEGETFRVAILSRPTSQTTESESSKAPTASEPPQTGGEKSPTDPPAPPVSEGEVRKVEIESIGDQGDGIAKVERGFVVIVPGVRVGENPRVRIDEVKENVAFGEVA